MEDSTEFSRVVSLMEIGGREKHHKIDANKDELSAVAERLSLISLSEFSSAIVLKKVAHEKGIFLTGMIRAVGEQECTVTTKPVAFELEEQLNIRFLHADKITPELEEENIYTLDSEDLEELPEDGLLDLGELSTQYLALSLNPYPRLEGAEVEGLANPNISINKPAEEKPNPFAKLEALRDKS